MDFPIDQIALTIEQVTSNWDQWLGYVIAAVAGFDKVAMVFIKTLENIRTQWDQSFPRKRKDHGSNNQVD